MEEAPDGPSIQIVSEVQAAQEGSEIEEVGNLEEDEDENDGDEESEGEKDGEDEDEEREEDGVVRDEGGQGF